MLTSVFSTGNGNRAYIKGYRLPLSGLARKGAARIDLLFPAPREPGYWEWPANPVPWLVTIIPPHARQRLIEKPT